MNIFCSSPSSSSTYRALHCLSYNRSISMGPWVPSALRSLSMSMFIAPAWSLPLRLVLQADRCLALINLLAAALSCEVLNILTFGTSS